MQILLLIKDRTCIYKLKIPSQEPPFSIILSQHQLILILSIRQNNQMRTIISKLLSKDKEEEKRQGQNKKKQERQPQKNLYTPPIRKCSLDESQEQEEILNTLINMSDHLKISRITKELQCEYITLRHVNKMLCQESIDYREIKIFLRSKSSEVIQIQKEPIKSKKSLSSLSKVVVHHYQNYSNGLIFQYYSVRALLWKISMGYLQPLKNKWISLMEGSLILYQDLVRDYILDLIMKRKGKDKGERLLESQEKKVACDHPLNIGKESKWKNFFDDRDLWNLIEKDTSRTKPSCKFFQQQHQYQFMDPEVIKRYGLKRSQVHLSKQKDKQFTYYYDCLTRIIYIYLKTNPQVSYSQGMNQLAAIVFYCFANKNSQYFRRVAESDAYFCFSRIMGLLKRYSPNGFLSGQKFSHKFEELLKKIDLRLYEVLQKNKQSLNNLKILSIKWFNSLFLTQFQIDETLILWDGFISIVPKEESEVNQQSLNFPNFLISLGLAIVHLNREKLFYGENPYILLSKITFSPEAILQKALNLYKIYYQFFQ